MADNKKIPMLYICATPIGNLEDITLRVLRILKEADFIAAEDTRRTKALLTHFDISKPLISYHEHNKYEKGKIIISRLLNGETAALVTDAGMPCVSDPGSGLVGLCIENGIPFTVCPGASAALTALVLSGISTDRFCFEGFLPTNKKERNNRLKDLNSETRTMIFYEAPHRLLEYLGYLKTHFGGERKGAVVREITKIYEETKRGSLEQLFEYFSQNPPKGEFVIIVEGRNESDIIDEKRMEWQKLSIDEHLNVYITEGMDRKDAMKAVAKDRGVHKSEIYSYLIENKDKRTT